MKTFKLMGGLGDCLLVGAVLQKLDRPVDFITNKLLEPVFEHHPKINFFSNGNAQYEFKWVSQIKEKNLYGLHTIQRFSSQLGFYLDPTEVLNVYGENGLPIINRGGFDIVVNQYSAEGHRRCIPDKYVDMIYEIADGDFAVKLIGSNDLKYGESTTSIKSMIDLLSGAKLFIGPVSFCYHLAACLRVNSVLFTSYMPPHKFSHFTNTAHITANAQCSFMCEQNNRACLPDCMAYSYDDDEVYKTLCKKIKT